MKQDGWVGADTPSTAAWVPRVVSLPPHPRSLDLEQSCIADSISSKPGTPFGPAAA